MVELLRDQLNLQFERAILFGLILPADRDSYEEPLEELRRLAETARVHVVDTLYQHKDRISTTYYIGRGKAEELKDLADRHDVDVLICDNNLSPHHVKNLEQFTGRKVIDRTELILDIFAFHARTHRAKLQVELAQLEYALPRLKRMWTHLSRIKHGIGMRGPGEKQLEEDRQIAQKKILQLKRDLDAFEQHTIRQVKSRGDEFNVSLVGYTNAGKSSLMKALSGADVKIADQLFATLDTRTRATDLGDGKKILLSDTVGFIKNLPHQLVASFQATLEAAKQADMLLHVVDVAHPDAELQIRAVNEVLDQLGILSKPTLMVFNKVDKLEDFAVLRLLEKTHPGCVAVSAATGQGLDSLKTLLREFKLGFSQELRFTADAGNGKLLAFLSERCEILDKRYEDSVVHIHARVPNQHFSHLLQLGAHISK